MKLKAIFLFIGLLTLQSCFFGSDRYEKTINDYFWLHREINTDETFLGTITDEGYSFNDKYLGPIEKIGWNDEYIIIKERTGDYYIQPMNKSNSAEKIKNDLIGPLNEREFKDEILNLNISKSLKFDTDY